MISVVQNTERENLKKKKAVISEKTGLQTFDFFYFLFFSWVAYLFSILHRHMYVLLHIKQLIFVSLDLLLLFKSKSKKQLKKAKKEKKINFTKVTDSVD